LPGWHVSGSLPDMTRWARHQRPRRNGEARRGLSRACRLFLEKHTLVALKRHHATYLATALPVAKTLRPPSPEARRQSAGTLPEFVGPLAPCPAIFPLATERILPVRCPQGPSWTLPPMKGIAMTDYLTHFGLKEAPFSTTPDPAFAFATREHKQALAKIAYYTEERRGMFLLLGEVGTGKTTISQFALNRCRSEPERFSASHITDPSPRTPAAFLRLVLASFGLPTMRNLLDLKAAFRGFLVDQYREGRAVVLLIDEAQTIQTANLDTLQAMANEQTQTAKLLQVVLFAQPNFEYKLTQKPALRSRIAGGTTLNPLTLDEATDLLRHRIAVAGGDFDRIFSAKTHKTLYNATNGVPRDLCVLCDAAMLNALAMSRRTVEGEAVERALRDLSFKGWAGKKAA